MVILGMSIFLDWLDKFFKLLDDSLLYSISSKYVKTKEIIKLQQENEDMELFMKKKEKYCSNKIKILLFDKHLTKIEHKRSGMQPISNFFSKG